MTDPPPLLTTPRLGDPIAPDDEVAYVKRTSAENQAEKWNLILRDDPIHGPASGFVVGVSPLQIEGRFALVWVRRETIGS